MNMFARKATAILAVLALVLVSGSVEAAGKGQTKIDFKVSAADVASSRIFFKFDVKATVDALGATGTPSKNDDLAGYTVNLFVNAVADPATGIVAPTAFGVADVKGKVAAPLDSKLTGNGKGMQIKATGLDLVTLFPLDAADGKDKSVNVTIKVTATKADSAGVITSEVVLVPERVVTFKYSTKKGNHKGKNF